MNVHGREMPSIVIILAVMTLALAWHTHVSAQPVNQAESLAKPKPPAKKKPKRDRDCDVCSADDCKAAQKTYVLVNDEFVEIPVEHIDGKVVFGGDVVLGSSREIDGFNAIYEGSGQFTRFSLLPAQDREALLSQVPLGNKSFGRVWNDGRVPYVLSKDVEKDKKLTALLKDAMADWATGTGVSFEPKQEDDKVYVRIVLVGGTTCTWWPGDTKLEIATGYKNCVHHELGHVLGLNHEHMRFDRGKHVQIIWKNIERGRCKQFCAVSEKLACGSYDLSSVMHYFATTGRCEAGAVTIKPFGGKKIGRKLHTVTDGDLAAAKSKQFGVECKN